MKKIPAPVFAYNLVALRSVCLPGQGRVSELLLSGGRAEYDPRRTKALVEALARHYAVDLVALRQRCSQLLHGRNYLPLPLGSELVLVPLALGQGGEKTGYINLLSVRAVLPRDKFSSVEAENGTVLDCELSVSSVRNRLLRAQLVLRELETMGLLPRPTDRNWQQKLDLIRAVLARD